MESVSVKVKRTIKEGLPDIYNFGFRVAAAKNACIWKNETLSSIQIKNRVILEYLEKEYGYILDKYRDQSESGINDVITVLPIWVFWWQGEVSMPEIIKLCHRSKLQNAANHPVILLTKENVRDYVDFPEYIWNQFLGGRIRIQHFADMIRIRLIRRYGGLWLDASVFCHRIIPEHAFHVPFFSLNGESMPEFVSDNRWTTFVIGGQKSNVLCSFLDDFFMDYCRNKKPFIDYFMFDCGIALAYRNLSAVKDSIDSLPKDNSNLYWLNTVLNKKADIELIKAYKAEQSVFYKVAWKQEWSKDSTLYEYLLSEGLTQNEQEGLNRNPGL